MKVKAGRTEDGKVALGVETDEGEPIAAAAVDAPMLLGELFKGALRRGLSGVKGLWLFLAQDPRSPGVKAPKSKKGGNRGR